MAAVRHLGFVKFEFFNAIFVILHQRTKFRKSQPNRCGDIAIFVIFQMAAAAMLNFQKFEILTVFPLYGGNMRHHAKLGQLKTQVRKTLVSLRICNGGKRKYSNLKSILKSLQFSNPAFSVNPLSVGLDQFTCTVPDRCYTQEIGLMLHSCAGWPGFKNRRRDAVE